MTDDEIIVTMKHIRAAGMCSGGPRIFFAQHGLDWSDFLRNGIPASKLLATGDAMAAQVVEVARGQRG